jgi:hypothetical protein
VLTSLLRVAASDRRQYFRAFSDFDLHHGFVVGLK